MNISNQTGDDKHFGIILGLLKVQHNFDGSQSSCFIQTDDLSQESFISNWSDEFPPSVSLSQYNTSIETLSNGRVSPLRFQLNKCINEVGDSTLRYLKRKTEESIMAVVEGIAPGQGLELLKLCYKNVGQETSSSCNETNCSLILEDFILLYDNMEDNHIKFQLLSMLSSKMSKADLLSTFPGLTKWKVDQARLHAARFGPGMNSRVEVVHRQRMDPEKMEHALNFFSDPSFLNCVSLGTKEIQLDSGEKLTIPDVVRTVCHSSLVEMYLRYCQETNFLPLGRSSLFNILNACAASKRRSLKGVDNIATDGASGYNDLLKMVDRLGERGLSVAVVKSLKSDLQSSRLYLKTDYKMHVQEEDCCADHCRQWALSDPAVLLHQTECEHQHVMCDRCNLISSAISQITKAINQMSSDEEKAEFKKELDDAVLKIDDWKAHILRTLNQDTSRFDTLEKLKSNQVLIVMDWAMKYLHFFYREKQSDWYAQKGMNWHASVCIFKDPSGNLKHRTYTHLMQSVKQDWFAVAGILEHTLTTVKKQFPLIDTAFIRSDNAGCYHCANLWLSIGGISARTGVQIQRYDYSEPSAGKSYCDAKFAHMRGRMRSYVASGNNIISPQDMKAAIDAGSGVAGCQTAVIAIDTKKQSLFSHGWRGVSNVNNLEFNEEGIRIWKAYNVGQGSTISKSTLLEFSKEQVQGDCLPDVLENFKEPSKGDGNIHIHNKERNQSEEATSSKETDIADTATSNSDIFYCPEPGRVKVYQRHSALENHILADRHKFKIERESSFDKIKLKWVETCNEVKNTTITTVPSCDNMSKYSSLKQGWALKKDRKNKRFSSKLKEYLNSV